MKMFVDTATGQQWEFEDNDDVRLVGGVWQVFDRNSKRLTNVPSTLVPGELPPPVESGPQSVTVFSSLDYLQKFMTGEYAAARNHSNISVQFGLDMLIAAQYVDLDDPRVAMTLDLLVTEGVLTPERRGELLTPQAA